MDVVELPQLFTLPDVYILLLPAVVLQCACITGSSAPAFNFQNLLSSATDANFDVKCRVSTESMNLTGTKVFQGCRRQQHKKHSKRRKDVELG